jgi:hypothetical protein
MLSNEGPLMVLNTLAFAKQGQILLKPLVHVHPCPIQKLNDLIEICMAYIGEADHGWCKAVRNVPCKLLAITNFAQSSILVAMEVHVG